MQRRRTGETQLSAATAQSTFPHIVREMELGRVPIPEGEQVTLSLSRGEWCAIQRRRRWWTMEDVANRLKVSRMTIWKCEHDKTSGVSALMKFYQALPDAPPPPAAPTEHPDEE